MFVPFRAAALPRPQRPAGRPSIAGPIGPSARRHMQQQQQQQQRGAPPASTSPSSSPSTSAPSPSSDLTSLFAVELSLPNWQVERLVRDLGKKGGQLTEVEHVRERLAALAMVAPGTGDIKAAAALACEDVGVLEQDPAAIASVLVQLKEALPKADAWTMVVKQPRLLGMQGPQFKEVIAKLTTIYPYKASNKRAEVCRLCEEYPELLFRMPFYLGPAVKSVQDLPVDLQNRLSKSHCG